MNSYQKIEKINFINKSEAKKIIKQENDKQNNLDFKKDNNIRNKILNEKEIENIFLIKKSSFYELINIFLSKEFDKKFIEIYKTIEIIVVLALIIIF